MAIQYHHPPSYQLHMLREYKDISLAFSDRGNNPYNSVNVDILPNLPAFQDFNMTDKTDADHTGASQLTDWTRRPPQEWTKKDVLDWAYCVVEQERLDGSKFKGEAYRDFGGGDLCRMDRSQFEEVDPYYGTIMYDSLQYLLHQGSGKKQNARPNSLQPVPELSNMNSMDQCWVDENNNTCMDERPYLERPGGCDNSNASYNSDLTVFRTDNEIRVEIPDLGLYPITQEFELPLTDSSCSNLTSQSFTQFQHRPRVSSPVNKLSVPSFTKLSETSSTEKLFSTFEISISSPAFQCMSLSRTTSSPSSPDFRMFQCCPPVSSSSPPSSSSLPMKSRVQSTDSNDLGYSSDDSTSSLSFMPPMRSPPRGDAFRNDDVGVGINDSSSEMKPVCDEDNLKQEGGKVRKPGATKSVCQLWKFVLELLRDPDANPRLLKWEDRNIGVFRFVQSEKVAKLWGQKKNNPQMTYEKMSRAMRFCRRIGYFSEINKDGRFPKKLCFKFGVKSQGWQD